MTPRLHPAFIAPASRPHPSCIPPASRRPSLSRRHLGRISRGRCTPLPSPREARSSPGETTATASAATSPRLSRPAPSWCRYRCGTERARPPSTQAAAQGFHPHHHTATWPHTPPPRMVSPRCPSSQEPSTRSCCSPRAGCSPSGTTPSASSAAPGKATPLPSGHNPLTSGYTSCPLTTRLTLWLQTLPLWLRARALAAYHAGKATCTS